jgi:lysophospholipase L1-like esterase
VAYSFDQIFAADPANPQNVASNAAVLIYAPGDATKTPLTITDPSGGPLANPVIVNANGFGSAFMHATLDRVAWDGGGFSGFFTSYEGMKQVATAAQTAAEAAAATAGAEAAAVATAAIGDATADADAAAASAAASATAAATAAATANAPTDTAMAAAINGTGETKTALNATILDKIKTDSVPKWKSTTAYLAGDKVVSPSGDVVSAKVDFTSGASFNATNWNYSATYAQSLLPAGITGTRRVDPGLGVYNRTGSSLRAWRAALVRQENSNTPARLLLEGNSIGMGANSSAPYYITSWFGGRIVDMIRKRFPDGGYGFNPLADTTGNADTRFTKTGTWTTSTGTRRGIGGGLALTTVDPAATLTYTPATSINQFIINHAVTTDGGSFTYTVDGGAPVTVNTNGAEAIGSTSITVTLGKPVIVITAPASGRLTLLGVQENVTGSGGVRVAKYGINGSVTNDHIVGTVATSQQNLVKNLVVPDLTLIDLITNDYGHGDVSIATFKANMTTMITNGLLSGSVALMIPIPPSGRRGPLGVPDSVPLNQTPVFDEFVQATYDLADQYDLMVIDLRMIYGDWATANAEGYMSDDYHPNDAGHRAIARAAYGALFDNWQSLTPPAFGSTGTWTAQQQFNGVTKFGTGSSWVQIGNFNVSDQTKCSVTNNGNDLLLRAATSGTVYIMSNLKMDPVTISPNNSGIIPVRIKGIASQSASLFRTEDSAGVEKFSLDQLGRPYVKSNLPTIATANGSTALSISGSDPAMTVNFTTANGTAAGSTVATVTYNTAYAGTPRLALSPLNAASVGAVYVTGKSTTGFSLAIAATQAAANAMSFDVQVIGS